jgi:hypothetical protein
MEINASRTEERELVDLAILLCEVGEAANRKLPINFEEITQKRERGRLRNGSCHND